MEGIDTIIYLACREDARKATREYVAAVVKAREERDAAHMRWRRSPGDKP